jgi:hypothetical protein
LIKRDIGDIGPAEGTVFYDWQWYYSALGVILWIATILVLVGLKSNRDPQAWLIFVPVLVVFLAWTIFKKVVGANSTGTQILDIIFDGLIFGQAIMWLLAEKISRKSRFINCLVSLIVMIAAGAAAVVSSLGFEFSTEGVATFVAMVILSLAIVCGQGLAGLMCRRKYSGVRYSLWAAFWEIVIIVVSMAAYGIFILVMIAAASRGTLQAFAVLAGIAMGAVLLGAVVYGVSLPFLILVQRNRFWRERFWAWSQAARPEPVNAAGPAENTPAS